MIIKLIKDVATDEMSNGVVLSEIGCPKKDVDKLIGIFEVFDKDVREILELKTLRRLTKEDPLS